MIRCFGSLFEFFFLQHVVLACRLTSLDLIAQMIIGILVSSWLTMIPVNPKAKLFGSLLVDDCSVLRISQNRDGTCPRKFAGLPLAFGFGLEDLRKGAKVCLFTAYGMDGW